MNNYSINYKMGDNLCEKDIDSIIRIYTQNFSRDLRIPYKEIMKRLSKNIYNTHVMYSTDNGEVIGFSFVVLLYNLNCVFIDYIAIDNKYQGKGLGKILFNHIYDFHTQNVNYWLLALECEDKLIGMYSKWGCKKVPINYDIYDNHHFNLMVKSKKQKLYHLYHKLHKQIMRINSSQFKILDEYEIKDIKITKYNEIHSYIIYYVLRQIYGNSRIYCNFAAGNS